MRVLAVNHTGGERRGALATNLVGALPTDISPQAERQTLVIDAITSEYGVA